jgi:hypothetical protein
MSPSHRVLTSLFPSSLAVFRFLPLYGVADVAESFYHIDQSCNLVNWEGTLGQETC